MARTNTMRFVTIGSTGTPCTSAPDRRAVDAHERRRKDFVRSVECELAGLGIEQQSGEVEQIAGVERARVRSEGGGDVRGGDDLDPVALDDLVPPAEGAVATLSHRH